MRALFYKKNVNKFEKVKSCKAFQHNIGSGIGYSGIDYSGIDILE
jgi:hypothetical protein